MYLQEDLVPTIPVIVGVNGCTSTGSLRWPHMRHWAAIYYSASHKSPGRLDFPSFTDRQRGPIDEAPTEEVMGKEPTQGG